MGEFVRNYIAQPVVGSPEWCIEGRQPYFDFIIEEISGTIGIIFAITQYNTHFGYGFMAVKFGNGLINLFSNPGNYLSTSAAPFLIVYQKMFTFYGEPIKMVVGVVVELRTHLCTNQSREKKDAHYPAESQNLKKTI